MFTGIVTPDAACVGTKGTGANSGAAFRGLFVVVLSKHPSNFLSYSRHLRCFGGR